MTSHAPQDPPADGGLRRPRRRPGPVGREVRRTVTLAGPVIGAQLGMMAMGLTDTLMVGPLGAGQLAAVSVGNAVFFAILVLFNGTVMALEPLISQAIGAGDRRAAGDHLWQGLWLAVGFGVPLTLLFVDFGWAFRLLGQKPEVVALAGTYLRGRAFAALPFLAFQAYRSFFNGVGRPRAVLVVTLAGTALNVGADWAFIYGHLGLEPLGVLGAGLATSVVRVAMLLAIAAFAGAPALARYRLPAALPRFRSLWRLLALGLPIGGQQFAEVAVFAAASVLAGWIGVDALAAHQIAMSVASTTFMVPLGLSMAATVRVGTGVGRGDPAGAMRAGRVALVLGGGVMAISALVLVSVPGLLARAFSPGPTVLGTAVSLIGIAAVFQVFDGLQITSAGCLRGAGDTRTPFVVTVLAHWLLGLPLGWLLAFHAHLGVRGLWWGLTAGLMAVAVVQTTLFLRGRWRARGRLVPA